MHDRLHMGGTNVTKAKQTRKKRTVQAQFEMAVLFYIKFVGF